MKNKIFTGACTALITPMSSGKIDYYSLDKLIEFQINNNISALVVSGTTGESAALSYKEHKDLIRHAVKRVAGRIPLIAGTGSNDTEKAIKMTLYAQEYGADAALIVTPYYNKTNQKGIVSHYEKISLSCDLPIIIYNVPGRTCVNILPETYKLLAKIENICGIKEASSNVSDAALTSAMSPDLPIYCGNDDLLIPMLAIGASGVVSVMSNIFPSVTASICSLYEKGNCHEACELYKKFIPFARMLFSDVNPIPIKCIMSNIGMCSSEIRLPLVCADKKTADMLITEYNKLAENL